MAQAVVDGPLLRRPVFIPRPTYKPLMVGRFYAWIVSINPVPSMGKCILFYVFVLACKSSAKSRSPV